MRKIFYLFLVSSLIISCEDDLGNVGLGLIPDKDILEVCLDSSTKVSSTFVNDDTISSRSYTVMLGGVTDPVLGTQKAHVISRFYWDYLSYYSLLPDSIEIESGIMENIDSLKKSYTIDIEDFNILSIDISFAISNYIYGDTSEHDLTHTFMVYDIGESIDTMIYHNYYTNGELPTSITNSASNKLIGEKTQKLILDDSVYKYLTISLDDPDFSNKIHNAITKDYVTGSGYNFMDKKGKYVLDSIYPFLDKRNSELIKKFNGLYIETVDARVLANFTNPKINVHYTSGGDTLTLRFVTVEASFLNYEDRDDNFTYIYPLTFFENNLLQDLNLGVENLPKTYVGGGLSYKTQIKLYELDKWLDNDSVLFNEFSIEIPFDTTHANSYSPPEVLNLTCKNPHVDYDYTWTAKIVLEDRYNSKGELVTPRSVSYKFYPTNFLYDFQNNRKNNKNFTSIADYIFEITDPSNYNDVDRVILNCGENSENIKVNIVYTKYK